MLAADKRNIDLSASPLNHAVIDIPPFIRDQEIIVKKQMEQQMEQFKADGLDTSAITEDEINEGEGLNIKALAGYSATLKNMERQDSMNGGSRKVELEVPSERAKSEAEGEG